MRREGNHVSIWRPYPTRTGRPHGLALWDSSSITSIEDCIVAIAGGRQYVFCHDLFDETEFPFSLELLKDRRSESYVTQSGRIVALRLKQKRQSGFLIPAKTWGFTHPGRMQMKCVSKVFNMFDMEAITPSSLSEKWLKWTMGDHHPCISRPSIDLRRALLSTPHGGRIDNAEELVWYEQLYEYDMNKAYLDKSTLVVSPFLSPIGMLWPSMDEWQAYPAAFVHCVLIAHNCSGKQPIQIESDSGQMRAPKEGEVIDRWLWTREVQACVKQGYTLIEVSYGYGYRELSDFMARWAETLYQKYEQVRGEPAADILKTMMVALPGRFLKRPETYTLVHISEAREGDVGILSHHGTTDWLVRTEPDEDSAQITSVGSYITMQCRMDMYERMKAEEQLGNQVVRAYIDCYAVATKTELPIGAAVGDFKEKLIEDVIVFENQMIPADIAQARIPGVLRNQARREQLRRLYALRLQKKGLDSS